MFPIKRLMELKVYTGYSVSCFTLDKERQIYILKKSVLFDDNKIAEKCYNIMNEYNTRFKSDVFLKITKCDEVYIIKDDIIHTFGGKKLNMLEHVDNQKYISYIESNVDEKSWHYMDCYVELFNQYPRRPKSCLMSFLCIITCCCLCFDTLSQRQNISVRGRQVR